jgi:uncharacterized protein YjbJ (UPF0337 family)
MYILTKLYMSLRSEKRGEADELVAACKDRIESKKDKNMRFRSSLKWTKNEPQ